ncbi:MAG: DUF3540 domain-containing protein [Sandaracinaceae bacterium]
MGSTEAIAAPLQSTSLEAVVTDIAEGERVTVRSVDEGALEGVRIAVVGYRPCVGDRVILTRTASSTFVIGVVASTAGVSVGFEDGAVVLRSSDGEVVLRHDPEAGETRLGSGAGDLLLEAPEGTLRLRAESVDIEADSIEQRARKVMTVATEVGISADRWDLRVHRIRERAGEVLRQVEGTLTTKSGRLRTIVKGSAKLFAKRTTIRSKQDTAIDGRQVLLG